MVGTAAAVAVVALTAFGTAGAQEPKASAQTPPAKQTRSVAPPKQAPADASAASALEPDALDALNRMGAYLRSLQAFSMRSQTTIDEVTDDGMKLQFGGTVTMQVQRPDKLRAELASDRKQRQLYFDGKTLTVYGAKNGYYATAPAVGTLKDLAEVADRDYNIRLPLTGLFSWGADGSTPDIKEAALIGPAHIGKTLCDQVAVRQEGLDWQVWIERGKTPLPRKLVITTLGEPSQPQYIAVMDWDTKPKFDAAAFRFVPPKDAHKIPLARADGAPTGGK
jgi:hypothetical protein